MSIAQKKKICKECGSEAYLFSQGRCKPCSIKSYGPIKKKPYFIKKTQIKKIIKNSGQQELFKKIWETSNKKCEVCNKPLEYSHEIFSHILGKGAYPNYKLNPDNIKLMCYEYQGNGCHNKWDTKAKSELTGDAWQRIKDLEQNLKQQYYKAPKK